MTIAGEEQPSSFRGGDGGVGDGGGRSHMPTLEEAILRSISTGCTQAAVRVCALTVAERPTG